MHVLAIIPARGGSKGIQRKNIVDVGGLPLVVHTIRHAQQAKRIDDFVVSSEDHEIRSIAESYGVRTMDRPMEFANDSTLQEVDNLLVWTVKEYEKNNQSPDIVVLLYPTAPLRDIESIDVAIEMVASGEYTSVLSVYHDTRYLWKTSNDVVEPTNYEPCKRMPRQKEIWNQWAENKAIYVMARDLLLDSGCRLGGNIGYVEMLKWRSIDIDKEEDLIMARALFESMIKDPLKSTDE